MKIANILNLTPSAITGLCQAIAKQNIPGLKAKTTSLVSALAKDEGLSSEAFFNKLEQMHKDAYWVLEKLAVFDYDGSVFKLSDIKYKVGIHGWPSSDLSCLSAVGGVYDGDGYTQDIRLFNGLGGFPNSDSEPQLALQNLQLGLANITDVINSINSRKKHLTPEILNNEGWSIKIGAGSKLLTENQRNKPFNIAVKESSITCPDCKAVENHEDERVFTRPFQVTPYGIAEFRVCQCCGRRTWLDEWDNPNAPEAPLEEDEVIAEMQKRMNKNPASETFSNLKDKTSFKAK